MPIQQMLLGAGGEGPKKYIDESFDIATFLGDASSETIYVNRGNGTAADGYAVWIQNRSSGGYGSCFGNSLIGTGKRWDMHTNGGIANDSGSFTSYNPNSNYFQIGSSNECNKNNEEYVAWTWSKQAGFFDMFSYVGNGSGNRTLSHSLGATVGAALWMPDTGGGNRYFWHRKTGSGVGLKVNSTDGATTNWITNASSTSITVNSALNANGTTYYLHLWAHDDQSFGENGDESVCYCGVIDENSGGSSQKITLGWQPRWILIKNYESPDSSGSNAIGKGNWVVIDNARNMGPTNNNNFILQANLNSAEHRSNMFVHPVSDGFWTEGMSYNANKRMIFMAIRDSGDKPFGDKNGVGDNPVDVHSAYMGNSQNGRQLSFGTGFKIALGMHCGIDAYNTPDNYGGFTSARNFVARQAGTSMRTRYGYDTGQSWNDRSDPRDYNPTIDLVSGKIVVGNDSDFNSGSNGKKYWAVAFQKLRGLIDVITYKGSSSTQSIRHHLGAVPRVMWVSNLENGGQHAGYFADVPNANQKGFFINKRSSNYGIYNGTTTYNNWNSTSPTATHFTVAAGYDSVNTNGQYHTAILFADAAGKIKSGGWDGDNSSKTITCGFYPKILFIWNLKPSSNSPSDQGGDGNSFMLAPGVDYTKNFMWNDYYMSGGSYSYYSSFIPNGQTYKRSDAQWNNPSQFPSHGTAISYSGTGFTVQSYLNYNNRSYYYLAIKD